MRSSDDGNSPVPNAFDDDFLKRIGERDEPPTAPEADVAGPWIIEPVPGAGFALFRSGEGQAHGFRATAVFRERHHALLAAAVLPGTGRDLAFRIGAEPELSGYPLLRPAGETAGHLRHFDQNLTDALHVVEALVRSPEALANLLEAAGGLALERAGAILDQRFSAPAKPSAE
jgi:hypothetical protein